MNRILFIALFIMALCSCRDASELPPLTDGYASDFIMPDPENLTQEERDYLEDLEEEYENSTN